MTTEPSNMDPSTAGIILPALPRTGLNRLCYALSNFNTAIHRESMMFFTSAHNLAGLNTLGKDDQVGFQYFP